MITEINLSNHAILKRSLAKGPFCFSWSAILVSGVLGLFTSLTCAAANPTAVFEFDDSPATRHIEHPAWFKHSFLDLRDDLAQAAQSDKKGIAIYFTQQDCSYCEAMIKGNFGRDDISIYTQRHFDIIPVDIWGERELTDIGGATYTEREYSILNNTNFTPSFLFYDTSGKLVLSLRGYHPPYRFRAALEYVVDGHYKRQTFADYVRRAEPPARFDENELNHKDFFLPPPHNMDRSLIKAARPLLVMFEQRKCHACDVFHSAPLTKLEIASRLDHFDVVQLDIDSDELIVTPNGTRTTPRKWAKRLGLVFAPTLIFFNETGNEVIRLGSVTKAYRLGQVMDYVLDGGYQQGLRYQLWHRERMKTEARKKLPAIE